MRKIPGLVDDLFGVRHLLSFKVPLFLLMPSGEGHFGLQCPIPAEGGTINEITIVICLERPCTIALHFEAHERGCKLC